MKFQSPPLRRDVPPPPARAIAGFIAALALLATPALLFAHAHLVRSSPAANAKLNAPPTALSLWFSERPELEFSSIKLLDSAGASVSLGPVTSGPDSMAVTVPLTGTIGGGKYTVTWRTAAADGHATSGRFTFTVTGSAAAPATTASIPPSPAPPATQTGPSATSKSNALVEPGPPATMSSAERWAELIAVLVLIGAVAFRLAILPGARWSDELAAEAADRARRLAQAALVLFIVATLIRAVAQSTLLPSVGTSRLVAVATLVQGTRWGRGWAVGAVGAIVILIGLWSARASIVGWLLAAAGVIAICLSEGLTGHSGTSRHFATAIASDLAHFLAAGAWLGGLTTVLLCGLPSLRRLGDGEGATAGSRLVRSYHNAAIECVALVVLTAILQAWLRLPTLSAFWTTPYGITLLLKIAAVIVVMLFGLYHYRRVVAREWQADTRQRFRRSATAELLVGAIVVAITAVLVSLPLPQ